jgi:DNA adenine methylase
VSRYKTPLRYPGGKQKLAPFIGELMVCNELDGGHYVEPYAGGAGVALELLFSGTASHVHLNDSCAGVYAFWRSVVNSPDELCRRIATASLTVDEWRRQKAILASPSKHRQIDVGFSMFFLNRCNRSGIAAGGVIGGLSQSGPWKMDARFSRNELIRRIEAIAAKKAHISIKNMDAEDFLRTYVPTLPKKTLVYCDPPYYHKAPRLYLNHYRPEDHARIARVIQRSVARPWVVSYDAAEEIRSCYTERKSFTYSLQYNARRVYRGTELLLFSDRLTLPAGSAVTSIDVALKRCQAA